ncbi:hypothetical protein Tco_0277275 [Tanacetum coccineum]
MSKGPKRLSRFPNYFKDKMLLMQAQENGAVLDEEQSLFLAGEQIINFDEDVDNSPENDIWHSMWTMSLKLMNVMQTTLMLMEGYKELVGEYEKRAKFELTDRERKIDEQMRIIISDRNRKETSLKSELHSAQILLSSTVGHYKSKTEEVIILKKDFKQKEDKFLEEFLDIKRLKDKIEDRLYKQDQSVQTVHMLCKPKSFYDEKNKVAIGYKNPLCLSCKASSRQSAPVIMVMYFCPHQSNTHMLYITQRIRVNKLSDSVKPKVLAPGMYAIDVKPIPHPLKNNRSAHLNYISHLKESVETVREIVEEARVECSSSNTQKHEVHQKVQQTNIPVIPSTGVNASTEASGSKPRSNTKKNRILPAKKENKKKVEVHLRTNKSVWTKVNRIDSSISYKRVVINSNSESVCKMCDKCLNSANHEMCVVNILSSVNATPTVKRVLNKGKQIWKPKGKLSDNRLNKTKRVWKATGKLFADIGYQWRPTGKKFTLGKLDCGYQWRPTGKKFALGEMCPLTKLSVKCSTLSANQQDPNKNWGTKIPNSPNSTVFKCRSYSHPLVTDSSSSKL